MLGNEVVEDKDERGKALSVSVERGAGIFCKIVIVCFLCVRYISDGLYYKMAGTPSSLTRFFIRVEIWLPNLRRAMHVYLTSINRKLSWSNPSHSGSKG